MFSQNGIAREEEERKKWRKRRVEVLVISRDRRFREELGK